MSLLLPHKAMGADPFSSSSTSSSSSSSSDYISTRTTPTPAAPKTGRPNSSMLGVQAPPDVKSVIPGIRPTAPKKKDHHQNSKKSSIVSLYDDIVKIEVGAEKQIFAIHRGLICKTSSFFRNIFKSNIKPEPSADYSVTKGHGSTILHLSKDNLNAFRRFNTWLYSKDIIVEGESHKDLEWEALVSLYLFAVHRSIPGLQNAVINASILKHNQAAVLPGTQHINRLYASNVHAPLFRSLFIDMFSQATASLASVMRSNRGYNPQFLAGIVIRVSQLREADKEMHKRRSKKRKRDADGNVITSPPTKVQGGEIDFWQQRERYHTHSEDNPMVLE